MSLLISKAKPNPAGKDRASRTFIPAAQHAAEWVDIKNVSASRISLDGVELYHYAYLAHGGTEWQLVVGLTGVLGIGETVRVHSGNPIALSQMRLEDQQGAEYHVFSGKDYVWNNYKDEFPRLWYKPSRQWLDQTSYDAFPPDGKILTRVGQKLV